MKANQIVAFHKYFINKLDSLSFRNHNILWSEVFSEYRFFFRRDGLDSHSSERWFFSLKTQIYENKGFHH